jgi:hypothetical protein
MDLSSLNLTENREGCCVLLKVRAGARRNAIAGPHGEALKIAVTAAPERGRANRAVLELLAEALGLPVGRLRILRGETSADKAVLVEGLGSEDLRRRLQGG